MNDKIPTPMLDKMRQSSDEQSTISQFLDWLTGVKKVTLASPPAHGQAFMGEDLCPHPESADKLIADYFEIDLVEVEKERRALVESLQRG